MALKLISRRAYTITANADVKGRWIENHVQDFHRLNGLYLMVLEGTGTNPPELNVRGDNYDQYGTTFSTSTPPTIQHITIDTDTQLILRGTGEGDGKTRVSFIKIGEIK